MSSLEETKKFLEKHCLQRCNHNANESCICKVAICFKEIEKAQEQEKENAELKKVLSIIKEKNLFEPTHKYIVGYTKVYATYSHMFRAYKLDEANKLTAEEFVLVKGKIER